VILFTPMSRVYYTPKEQYPIHTMQWR
jgi:hypothetical protein